VLFPSRTELPWHELLLLALVAMAALTVVYPPGAQDVSRLCLTRAAVHGHLSADTCLHDAVDVASYGGHLYSDKAPGVSILAIPIAEVVRLPDPSHWHYRYDFRVWATRVAVQGLALLLCAFLVGRVAEGLAPRTGGPTLVAFALGTEAAALSSAGFAHVPAAALAFAAFLLAWRRSPFLAGLIAGAAVLVEYETGLVALVLAGYVLLFGRRALGRYVLGALPSAVALGAYNWAAFGSPFHLSYRYVADAFAANQAAGFFGIHAPSWHAIRLVFVGDQGLLIDSPLVVAAAHCRSGRVHGRRACVPRTQLWLLRSVWRRLARAAVHCALAPVPRTRTSARARAVPPHWCRRDCGFGRRLDSHRAHVADRCQRERSFSRNGVDAAGRTRPARHR